MLDRQLETPLDDMTALDHFMTDGAGRNCSRLRVLKDLFDRAGRMPFPPIYTPRFLKIMHTAEYIHQTFTPRDYTLLATEMRIMAPCVDVLRTLVQSLFYVYDCTDFQLFSTSGHGITSRAGIERRRLNISDAMLSAGVFDRMLTVCAQHPAQYEFLYRFLQILTESSLGTQRTFFAVQNNMSVLQELTLDATSHDRDTWTFDSITYQYAKLMEALYREEEGWHRRAPEHGEVDVAVAMLTVMFRIKDLSNDVGAWKLCRTVVLYMKNSTLLTLHRLGWIDKLCNSVHYYENAFQRFLVRFIAALSNQDAVSEEDRAWIQAHPPSAEGYLSE
jgi:hypothetical protein